MLGHTRLSIQDLTAASNQPWVEEGVALTYNGEMWSPEVLRSSLSGPWRTRGDTEPVARIIAHEGTEGLRALADGMFALAWSDGDAVWLARDPYGEVPLHYGWTPDKKFRWASEIGPLLAVGAHPRSIQWVPPGCWVRCGADGSLTAGRWYHPPREDRPLRDLLVEGTAGRLTSDAPVALLISGGLDSSAIAAAAGRPLPAYTAVHDPKSHDLKFARVIAERLGLDLVEVPVPAPTAEDLERVVSMIEMPHKAQIEIAWACWHLAQRLQADGIRVVLSGEGSDELLASYGMAYHGIKQHGWYKYRHDLFCGQHRKNFARTNKVFMHCGVEARLPFLHGPLVARLLACSQEEVTMAGRHPKAILAAAFEDSIGADAAWRPKAAFQTEARLDKAAAAAVKDPTGFYRATFTNRFQGVTA